MATSIYICEECEAPLAKRGTGRKARTRDANRKHLRALRDGCPEHPKAGIRLTFTDLAPDRGPEAIAAARAERITKRGAPRRPERPRLGLAAKEVIESGADDDTDGSGKEVIESGADGDSDGSGNDGD